MEELAKDFLDPGSGFHEPGEELVHSVQGMILMVGLERLEHPCGRGRNARVVQVGAMLVDRKQLSNLSPHGFTVAISS
jgi:hypothetical protein